MAYLSGLVQLNRYFDVSFFSNSYSYSKYARSCQPDETVGAVQQAAVSRDICVMFQSYALASLATRVERAVLQSAFSLAAYCRGRPRRRATMNSAQAAATTPSNVTVNSSIVQYSMVHGTPRVPSTYN